MFHQGAKPGPRPLRLTVAPLSCASRCAQMTESDREAINGIYRRSARPHGEYLRIIFIG
jgi:hypothetical protein